MLSDMSKVVVVPAHCPARRGVRFRHGNVGWCMRTRVAGNSRPATNDPLGSLATTCDVSFSVWNIRDSSTFGLLSLDVSSCIGLLFVDGIATAGDIGYGDTRSTRLQECPPARSCSFHTGPDACLPAMLLCLACYRPAAYRTNPFSEKPLSGRTVWPGRRGVAPVRTSPVLPRCDLRHPQCSSSVAAM